MFLRSGLRLLPWCVGAAAIVLLETPKILAQPTTIDVVTLYDSSILGQQEMGVLSEIVRATITELPQERFETGAVVLIDGKTCGDECQLTAIRQRSAHRAVLGSARAFGSGYIGALALYDTATGQLLSSHTTAPVAALDEMPAAMQAAARELRGVLEKEQKLFPNPLPNRAAPGQPEQPALAPLFVLPLGVAVGRLQVVTSPSGAYVYIHKRFAGVSPLEQDLAALTYQLRVELADHKPVRTRVRIDPGRTEVVSLDLERIYPRNPYKKAGHAFIWPGILATTFGFAAMAMANGHADSYQENLDHESAYLARTWTGVMWGSFGVGAALLTAGFVSLAKSPGDREYFERYQSPAAAGSYENVEVPVIEGGPR